MTTEHQNDGPISRWWNECTEERARQERERGDVATVGLCPGWLTANVARAADRTAFERAGLTDTELLRRAVKAARARRRPATPHYRWTAVMDVFGLGSTYAQALCRRFYLDPDEMVRS